MADEKKTAYLDRDADLATVRELFQRSPSRRIELVVPSDTQLRTHMSWKLIHGYARDAGKEVTVVSSDRAIRTVVKAAGFRVADSLEAARPSKGRYGSRGGRTDTRAGGRAASRVRTPPTHEPEPPSTGAGRSSASRRPIPPASNLPIDDLGPGDMMSSRPPIFGEPSPIYGPEYNFSAGEMRPGSPPLEDEEDELALPGTVSPQDIERATDYRLAAQGGARSPEQGTARPEPPIDTSLAHAADDETLTMHEQRASFPSGSASRGGSGTSDLPTFPGEIEDLGERDDFPQSSSPPYAQWSEEDVGQDIPAPRVRGVPSRASQSGLIRASDIADRATADMPEPAQPRSPAKPPTAGSGRSPEGLMLPQPGQAAQRTPSRAETADRSRAPSKVPARRQATSARRGGGSALPIVVGLLIFLAILALLFYFVPSATVTVTLPAQAYHEQMAYTASPGSPLNIVTHTMPAQTLSFPVTVQGIGHATGSKPVGTAPASGTVTFTNKNGASVEIPTGTIVTTSSGVAFATSADALVLGNGTFVIPVQASQSGTGGNVPANTITVIPQSTITRLQQANPGVTISLAVTNENPTTGGGTRGETTVSANDVKNEAAKLSPQVNSQVSDYLRAHTSTGDVTGTPQLTSTPLASPPVGSIVNNGTFTLILHVRVNVLVVHAADLQNVANQQINAALQQAKSNDELVPQQPVQITDVKAKDSTLHSAKALSLTFNALGQIVPQVSVDQIRGIVSGKSPASAQAALLDKHNGITAIQKASVTVNPSFIGLVPFWQQHITVVFKTGAPVTTPKPKATPTPHTKK
jgi:hypothetical protein